jgi:hypothetical protein
VQSIDSQPTFQRNISPPSSGSKNNGNAKPIKSLLKGKGLLPLVGLARLDL